VVTAQGRFLSDFPLLEGQSSPLDNCSMDHIRAGYACGASFPELAGGEYFAGEDGCAYRTQAAGRRGGLVPSQEAGLYDGRGTSGLRAAGERLI